MNPYACMWTEGPGEPHEKLLTMTATGRKTWAAGKGDGAGGDGSRWPVVRTSFSVYTLPFVLSSVMDHMSLRWLLWLAHSPLPVFLAPTPTAVQN